MEKYLIYETHTYVEVYEVEAEDETDALDNYRYRGTHLVEQDKDIEVTTQVEGVIDA